jgi:hypothetical protein
MDCQKRQGLGGALPLLFPVYTELLANFSTYPKALKNSSYVLNIHSARNPPLSI